MAPPPQPTVTPICNGTVSSVNVSWSEAGRGAQGYSVDISASPDFSQFVNKFVPSGTTSTTFGSEANLQGGTTYYVRVYYGVTQEHSPTANFTANTCSHSIAGAVSYGIANPGQTESFVSGVNLTLTGTANATVASNSSGSYQFLNLPGGNYTVTPSKTGDVTGINSLDATRIQQHLVGLTTLTANQLIAADTDGSGTVNSLDATRIQQRAVGIQTQNTIGQWKFVPGSRQYNALGSNQTGQNYQAVLVGEVSGNWATAASFTENSLNVEDENEVLPETDNQTAERFTDNLFGGITEHLSPSTDSLSYKSSAELGNPVIQVSLPTNATRSSGSTVTIPITIGVIPAGSPIESFDFSVFYNPAVLQPAATAGSNTGTLSANCLVLPNSPVSGRVVVSGACAQAVTTGSGVLYNLTFNVIGSANQASSLSFTNPANNTNTFQFNNGTPTVTTTNGQFTVLTPTAAEVSIGGRFITAAGRGIRNVRITLTDSSGATRTAISTTFGYYRFDNVRAGETYIITATGKQYEFSPPTQVINVNEDTVDISFTANPR
ncbi:MAG: dockerin type I domain-containing protein [Pyrinomonadaceae bacterium]